MAQTGYTPISIYYSSTASNVPTAANLVPGELAINTADGKLYYEDSSGVVQVLATKSTGSIGGSNTQVQFNNSGSLGGSSSFTWDGTTVTATKFAGALNGTVGATTASTGAFTTLSTSSTTTLSGLTASTALALDASKNVVSVTNTGTGNNVLSASPTLTGTIAGASLSLSSLTSGRVPYATTAGLLTDSANLLYSGTDLTVYGLTVGRGGGAVATNTAMGASALASGSQTGTVNTAIGAYSLFSNTSGTGNTGVGQGAMYLNTTGGSNSSFGDGALGNNTTGSSNTALGRQALTANTTASNNTAVGYQAAYSNTTGQITAVGYQALYNNTTGVANVAIGKQALSANTSGNYNVAIGNYYDAGGAAPLNNNTTGSRNIAIGSSALRDNTTGSWNVAYGYGALNTNTTGINNTAYGSAALYYSTTASNNTAVGYQTGYSNTTGSQNTFIGLQAGYSLTTGIGNTFVGGSYNYGSGYLMTTGSKNTIIGSFTGNQGGLDIRTSNNYIVLSDGDGNPLITTANSQTVALKGAVPNSGTGITFPATQSASSDANTLDDYEEGTWTPTFGTGWTTSPSVATTATYVKIGKQVTISVYLLNGVSTANALITGLPFSVSVESSMVGFSGSTSTAPLMTGVTQSGTTQIRSIPAAVMTSLYWTVTTTYFTS